MNDIQTIYPHRKAGIKATFLPDGHLVLFDQSTELAHTLNPSGALVWEFCDGKTCLAEIAATIAKLTGRADAEQESVILVEELCASNLLACE